DTAAPAVAPPKTDEPLLPPTGVPLGTPVWSATPSSPSGNPATVPPQSGMRTAPTATPVWMVNPQLPARPVSMGNTGQRNPQDFGQGWKDFVNQQMGRQAPAAMLSAPRGAVMPGPRPDWGWHGYDGWNQGNRVPLPSESLSQASTMAADMAPYLKYAHLWKLS